MFCAAALHNNAISTDPKTMFETMLETQDDQEPF